MVWWTQFETKYWHLWIRSLGNISLSIKLWNVNSSSWFETRTSVEILKFLWDGNFLFQCILVLILIYPGELREMKSFSIHKGLGRKPPTGTKMDYWNKLCLEMFWSKQFYTHFYCMLSFLPLKQANEAQTFHSEISWVSIAEVRSEAWPADCYHTKRQKQLH